MTEKGAGISRRQLLTGGSALVVGAGAGALAGRARSGAADGAEPAAEAVGTATVAFRGARQPGVATAPPAVATYVALDVRDGVDRAGLVRLMRMWTEDAERLMAGSAPLADTEPELAARPARLTVTVGYGPGLFTAAGLDARRPNWLAPLPAFAVDRLSEAWSGGDLLLGLAADDELAVAHAARVLLRDARTYADVRWTQRGFRNAPGVLAPGAATRNLMGQVDGTRNLDPAAQPGLVWQLGDAGSWLADGTALVFRRIAMNLDTWEAVDRVSREAAIGRRLADGAPLTGTRESDVPDLSARDAQGFTVIGPAAHVRRATATTAHEHILRRPYNYLDESGAGLLFLAYCADPVAQFLPIQRRLADADLLNIWTTPVGSAVFAIPPGARAGEYLGEPLLT